MHVVNGGGVEVPAEYRDVRVYSPTFMIVTYKHDIIWYIFLMIIFSYIKFFFFKLVVHNFVIYSLI